MSILALPGNLPISLMIKNLLRTCLRMSSTIGFLMIDRSKNFAVKISFVSRNMKETPSPREYYETVLTKEHEYAIKYL
jgi:hypothetical protein